MAMKKENGLIEITRGEALAHLGKVLLKRGGKSWNTTLLVVDQKGSVDPMPHTMAYSYITPLLEGSGALRKKNALVSADGLTNPEERYCDAILMVACDTKALSVIFDGKTMKPRYLYRVLDKVDSFWVKLDDHTVGNLCTGEKMEARRFQNWAATMGCYCYDGKYATSSAGELKKYVVQLPGQYFGKDKARKLDWASIYDKMSGGAWTIFNGLHKTLNYKEIAQFAMRMAQSKAPCQALDYVPARVYSVIPGTFQRENVVNVTGEKFDFMDGLGFELADYTAELFNGADGIRGKYHVTPEACEGQLKQQRPASVCKQTFLSVNRETMRYLKKVHMPKLGEVKILAYKGMTAQQIVAWTEYCMSKGKSGSYTDENGKEIVLADKMVTLVLKEGFEDSEPDYLNDFNGQKTVFHPALLMGPRILNIAHLDSTKGYLSTQVLQSFLAADFENGKAMAMYAAIRDVAKAWKSLNPEVTEGKALSWADFQGKTEDIIDEVTGEVTTEVKNINYSELANTVAPGFAKKFWAPAYRSMVDRKLKGLSTKFNKCNFSQRVIHTTLIPDVAAVIAGTQILRENVDTDIVSCFGNGSGNLSKTEYIAAVQASSADDEGKKHAIRLIKKLHRGITAVPASEEAAKAGEGWDYDGDSWYESLDYGYANRYPKTHSRGYFRLMESCVLPTPLCVDKD